MHADTAAAQKNVKNGAAALPTNFPEPEAQGSSFRADALKEIASNHRASHPEKSALFSMHSQQTHSSLQLPLDSSCYDRVTCPPQLSDESFAKFVIELPLLDESRLSPELVACAAKIRAKFVDASSNAQIVLQAMRDAWIAWNHLPVASPGTVLCYFVCRVAQICGNLFICLRDSDVNPARPSLQLRSSHQLLCSPASPRRFPSSLMPSLLPKTSRTNRSCATCLIAMLIAILIKDFPLQLSWLH
jgi:hypothetical protein